MTPTVWRGTFIFHPPSPPSWPAPTSLNSYHHLPQPIPCIAALLQLSVLTDPEPFKVCDLTHFLLVTWSGPHYQPPLPGTTNASAGMSACHLSPRLPVAARALQASSVCYHQLLEPLAAAACHFKCLLSAAAKTRVITGTSGKIPTASLGSSALLYTANCHQHHSSVLQAASLWSQPAPTRLF